SSAFVENHRLCICASLAEMAVLPSTCSARATALRGSGLGEGTPRARKELDGANGLAEQIGQHCFRLGPML
ncbi:hypothetical protein ACSTHM_23605, partial [Vibrio parahaemolyticus]